MAYKINVHTKNWTEKPPLGSDIDWNNPMSRKLIGCFLFNENGGKLIQNLVDKRYGTLNAASSWGYNEKGSCLVSATNYDTLAEKTTSIQYGTNDFCFVFSLKTTVSIGYIIARKNPVAPYNGLDLGNYFNQFQCNIDDGDNSTNVRSGTAYNDGIAHQWIVNGIRAGNLTYYRDLVSTATGSIATVPGDLAYNNILTYDANVGAFTNYIYIFGRALDVYERRSIYRFPYQFIKPIKRRFYSTSGVTPPVTSKPRRKVLISCLD